MLTTDMPRLLPSVYPRANELHREIERAITYGELYPTAPTKQALANFLLASKVLAESKLGVTAA